eukprot:445282-Prymnesium_polylepis.1
MSNRDEKSRTIDTIRIVYIRTRVRRRAARGRHRRRSTRRAPAPLAPRDGAVRQRRGRDGAGGPGCGVCRAAAQ